MPLFPDHTADLIGPTCAEKSFVQVINDLLRYLGMKAVILASTLGSGGCCAILGQSEQIKQHPITKVIAEILRPEPWTFIYQANGVHVIRPKSSSVCKERTKRLMEVIVYSAPWCYDCREATRFLAQHNILYKEINIDSTPGAAEEIILRTGKRAIPQFVIDGQWVQPYRPGEGFLYEEMKELLGLAEV